MDVKTIGKILEEVEKGKIKAGEAMDRLRHIPYADMGVGKHDGHRALRNEFSEVILCEGKTKEHLFTIVDSLCGQGLNVFGTRVDEVTGKEIAERFSDHGADHDPVSRTFRIVKHEIAPLSGRLAIVCAGTADLPVAEEARRTAEYFGFESRKFYDVGVAGLHRLVSCLDEIRHADCVIVVAGMEGALPSVVGGLISSPIVACPTSVGYGANLKGFTALLAMLSSCSEGISVVNIDNGFGAACAAIRILRRISRHV